jgi:hypothetical protein
MLLCGWLEFGGEEVRSEVVIGIRGQGKGDEMRWRWRWR